MATKKKKATPKKKPHPATEAPVSRAETEAAMITLPLPAVPVLQRALVLWCTGHGQQKDLPAAMLARQLCAGGCFFCGKGDVNPTMAPQVDWSEVEICGCLPAEQSFLNPDWGSAPLGEGYEEVLPGWQDRQAELSEKARMRQLDPRRAVYRNACVRCEQKFEVSVGTVASSIERYGAHAIMNRCKPCRDAAVARKGARPQNKRQDEAAKEAV